MSTEHDDPFLDLGYTSPEQAEELRRTMASQAVPKVVKRPVYRGKPRVAEDSAGLLNVDTEPTPLTPDEVVQSETVWARREQSIQSDLRAQWEAACRSGDTSKAALLQKRMGERAQRQQMLGRPPVQPTK